MLQKSTARSLAEEPECAVPENLQKPDEQELLRALMEEQLGATAKAAEQAPAASSSSGSAAQPTDKKRATYRRLAAAGLLRKPLATKEEIDVYRGNWWIRSNVVNFDTMPTRHQLDFKKTLSTLYRLKKAEDKKHYDKWSQSSSSWWQWQTNWWEPYYENSPQSWSDH